MRKDPSVMREETPKGEVDVPEEPGETSSRGFCFERPDAPEVKRLKIGSRSGEGAESPDSAACQSGRRGPYSFASQESAGRALNAA